MIISPDPGDRACRGRRMRRYRWAVPQASCGRAHRRHRLSTQRLSRALPRGLGWLGSPWRAGGGDQIPARRSRSLSVLVLRWRRPWREHVMRSVTGPWSGNDHHLHA